MATKTPVADVEPSMVSMKRTAADKRGDKMENSPIDAMAPDYPYGLCIHMDKDELDKLAISTLPAVGAVMTFEVKVKVTRVSQSAAENADEQTSVDFQITDIGIETDD